MVFLATKAAIIAAILTLLGLYFSDEMRKGNRPFPFFTNPRTPSSHYGSSEDCNCQLITSCLSSLKADETPKFCGFEGIQRKICCDPEAEEENDNKNSGTAGGSGTKTDERTKAFRTTAQIQSQAAKFYRNQFLYNNERIRGSGWSDHSSTSTTRFPPTRRRTTTTTATPTTPISTRRTTRRPRPPSSSSTTVSTTTSTTRLSSTIVTTPQPSTTEIPPPSPEPSTTIFTTTIGSSNDYFLDPETEKPTEDPKLPPSEGESQELDLKQLQKDAGSFLAEFFPDFYNDLVKNLTKLDNVTFIGNVPVPKEDKTSQGQDDGSENETENALRRLFEQHMQQMQDEYYSTTESVKGGGGYDDSLEESGRSGGGLDFDTFDFDRFLNITGLTMLTSTPESVSTSTSGGGESGTTSNSDIVGTSGDDNPESANEGDSSVSSVSENVGNGDDKVPETTTKGKYDSVVVSPLGISDLFPEEKVEGEGEKDNTTTLSSSIAKDDDTVKDDGGSEMEMERGQAHTTPQSEILPNEDKQSATITDPSTPSSVFMMTTQNHEMPSNSNNSQNSEYPDSTTASPHLPSMEEKVSEENMSLRDTTEVPIDSVPSTEKSSSEQPSIPTSKSQLPLGETTIQTNNVGSKNSDITTQSTLSHDQSPEVESSTVTSSSPSVDLDNLTSTTISSAIMSTTTEKSEETRPQTSQEGLNNDDSFPDNPLVITTTTETSKNSENQDIPSEKAEMSPISLPAEIPTTMSIHMDETSTKTYSEDILGPTQISSAPTGHSLLQDQGVPDDPDHNEVGGQNVTTIVGGDGGASALDSYFEETLTTTRPSSTSASTTETPSSSSKPGIETEPTTVGSTEEPELTIGKTETNPSIDSQFTTSTPTSSYSTTTSSEGSTSQPESDPTTISSSLQETTPLSSLNNGESLPTEENDNVPISQGDDENGEQDMMSTTELSPVTNPKINDEDSQQNIDMINNEVMKALDEEETATTIRPEVSSSTTAVPSNLEKSTTQISPPSERAEQDDELTTTQIPQIPSTTTAKSGDPHDQESVPDNGMPDSTTEHSDHVSLSDVKITESTTEDQSSLFSSSTGTPSHAIDSKEEKEISENESEITTTIKYPSSSSPELGIDSTTQILPNAEQSENAEDTGRTTMPTKIESNDLPSSTTEKSAVSGKSEEVDLKSHQPEPTLEENINPTTEGVDSVPETTQRSVNESPIQMSVPSTTTSTVSPADMEHQDATISPTTEGVSMPSQGHVEDEVTTESAIITTTPFSDINGGGVTTSSSPNSQPDPTEVSTTAQISDHEIKDTTTPKSISTTASSSQLSPTEDEPMEVTTTKSHSSKIDDLLKAGLEEEGNEISDEDKTDVRDRPEESSFSSSTTKASEGESLPTSTPSSSKSDSDIVITVNVNANNNNDGEPDTTVQPITPISSSMSSSTTEENSAFSTSRTIAHPEDVTTENVKPQEKDDDETTLGRIHPQEKSVDLEVTTIPSTISDSNIKSDSEMKLTSDETATQSSLIDDITTTLATFTTKLTTLMPSGLLDAFTTISPLDEKLTSTSSTPPSSRDEIETTTQKETMINLSDASSSSDVEGGETTTKGQAKIGSSTTSEITPTAKTNAGESSTLKPEVDEDAPFTTQLPKDLNEDALGESLPTTTENILPTFSSTTTTESSQIIARDDMESTTEGGTIEDNLEKQTTENVFNTVKSSTTSAPSSETTPLNPEIEKDQDGNDDNVFTTTARSSVPPSLPDSTESTTNSGLDEKFTSSPSSSSLSSRDEIESTTQVVENEPSSKTSTNEPLVVIPTTQSSSTSDGEEGTTKGHEPAKTKSGESSTSRPEIDEILAATTESVPPRSMDLLHDDDEVALEELQPTTTNPTSENINLPTFSSTTESESSQTEGGIDQIEKHSTTIPTLKSSTRSPTSETTLNPEIKEDQNELTTVGPTKLSMQGILPDSTESSTSSDLDDKLPSTSKASTLNEIQTTTQGVEIQGEVEKESVTTFFSNTRSTEKVGSELEATTISNMKIASEMSTTTSKSTVEETTQNSILDDFTTTMATFTVKLTTLMPTILLDAFTATADSAALDERLTSTPGTSSLSSKDEIETTTQNEINSSKMAEVNPTTQSSASLDVEAEGTTKVHEADKTESTTKTNAGGSSPKAEVTDEATFTTTEVPPRTSTDLPKDDLNDDDENALGGSLPNATPTMDSRPNLPTSSSTTTTESSQLTAGEHVESTTESDSSNNLEKETNEDMPVKSSTTGAPSSETTPLNPEIGKDQDVEDGSAFTTTVKSSVLSTLPESSTNSALDNEERIFTSTTKPVESSSRSGDEITTMTHGMEMEGEIEKENDSTAHSKEISSDTEATTISSKMQKSEPEMSMKSTFEETTTTSSLIDDLTTKVTTLMPATGLLDLLSTTTDSALDEKLTSSRTSISRDEIESTTQGVENELVSSKTTTEETMRRVEAAAEGTTKGEDKIESIPETTPVAKINAGESTSMPDADEIAFTTEAEVARSSTELPKNLVKDDDDDVLGESLSTTTTENINLPTFSSTTEGGIDQTNLGKEPTENIAEKSSTIAPNSETTPNPEIGKDQDGNDDHVFTTTIRSSTVPVSLPDSTESITNEERTSTTKPGTVKSRDEIESTTQIVESEKESGKEISPDLESLPTSTPSSSKSDSDIATTANVNANNGDGDNETGMSTQANTFPPATEQPTTPMSSMSSSSTTEENPAFSTSTTTITPPEKDGDETTVTPIRKQDKSLDLEVTTTISSSMKTEPEMPTITTSKSAFEETTQTSILDDFTTTMATFTAKLTTLMPSSLLDAFTTNSASDETLTSTSGSKPSTEEAMVNPTTESISSLDAKAEGTTMGHDDKTESTTKTNAGESSPKPEVKDEATFTTTEVPPPSTDLPKDDLKDDDENALSDSLPNSTPTIDSHPTVPTPSTTTTTSQITSRDDMDSTTKSDISNNLEIETTENNLLTKSSTTTPSSETTQTPTDLDDDKAFTTTEIASSQNLARGDQNNLLSTMIPSTSESLTTLSTATESIEKSQMISGGDDKIESTTERKPIDHVQDGSLEKQTTESEDAELPTTGSSILLQSDKITTTTSATSSAKLPEEEMHTFTTTTQEPEKSKDSNDDVAEVEHTTTSIPLTSTERSSSIETGKSQTSTSNDPETSTVPTSSATAPPSDEVTTIETPVKDTTDPSTISTSTLPPTTRVDEASSTTESKTSQDENDSTTTSSSNEEASTTNRVKTGLIRTTANTVEGIETDLDEFTTTQETTAHATSTKSGRSDTADTTISSQDVDLGMQTTDSSTRDVSTTTGKPSGESLEKSDMSSLTTTPMSLEDSITTLSPRREGRLKQSSSKEPETSTGESLATTESSSSSQSSGIEDAKSSITSTERIEMDNDSTEKSQNEISTSTSSSLEVKTQSSKEGKIETTPTYESTTPLSRIDEKLDKVPDLEQTTITSSSTANIASTTQGSVLTTQQANTDDDLTITTTESQQLSKDIENSTFDFSISTPPSSDMKTENILDLHYSSTSSPEYTTISDLPKAVEFVTTEGVPQMSSNSESRPSSTTTLETLIQDEITTKSTIIDGNTSVSPAGIEEGDVTSTVRSSDGSSTLSMPDDENMISTTTETSTSSTTTNSTIEMLEKLNEEIVEKLDQIDLGFNMSTSTESSSTDKYMETPLTTTSSPNVEMFSTTSVEKAMMSDTTTTEESESDVSSTTPENLNLEMSTTMKNLILPPSFMLNITEIFPEPGSSTVEPKTSVTSSKTELKTTSTKSSTFSPIHVLEKVTESTSTPSSLIDDQDENTEKTFKDSTTSTMEDAVSSHNKTAQNADNSTDFTLPGLNDLEFVPDYPEQFHHHNDSSEIDSEMSTTNTKNVADSVNSDSFTTEIPVKVVHPIPRKLSDGVTVSTTPMPESTEEIRTTSVPKMMTSTTQSESTTQETPTTTENISTTMPTFSESPPHPPSSNSSDNPQTIVSFIVSVSATRTKSSKSKSFTETHNVTYHMTLNHTEHNTDSPIVTTTTTPVKVNSESLEPISTPTTTNNDGLVFDDSTSTTMNPILDSTTTIMDYGSDTTTTATERMDQRQSTTTYSPLQEISTIRLSENIDNENKTASVTDRTTVSNIIVEMTSTPSSTMGGDDESVVFDEMTSTSNPTSQDTGLTMVDYENVTETTMASQTMDGDSNADDETLVFDEMTSPSSTPTLQDYENTTTPTLDKISSTTSIPQDPTPTISSLNEEFGVSNGTLEPENTTLPVKDGPSTNKTFRNLELSIKATTLTPEIETTPENIQEEVANITEIPTTTDSSNFTFSTTEKVLLPNNSSSSINNTTTPGSTVDADFADLFTSNSRSNPNSSLILDIITRPPPQLLSALAQNSSGESPSNKTEEEISLTISTGRGNRSLTNPEAIEVAKELGSQISNVVNQLLLTTHKKFHLLPLFTECANAKRPRKKSRVLNLEYEHLSHVVRIGAMEKGGLVFGCAGTLISKRYVLTSAYCLQNKYPITTTLLEDELNNKSYVDIESIIIHPEFSNQTHANDIALIRLKDEQAEIKPICLPFEDAYGIWESIQQSPGDTAMLSGWTKKLKRSREVDLSEAAVDIVPQQNCTLLIKSKEQTDFPSQICTTSPVTFPNYFTRGSPLTTVMTRHKLYFQIGILSNYNNNAQLYTRITTYLQWILDSIEE